MKFKVWNKKENRPANVDEMTEMFGSCDGQFFVSWSSNPKEGEEGNVEFLIDSAMSDDFEFRKI